MLFRFRFRICSIKTKRNYSDILKREDCCNSIQRNEIGIQILPPKLHDKLFTKSATATKVEPWRVEASKKHLQKQGLWNRSTSDVEDASFLNLPPLEGPDLHAHFQEMARITHGNYLNHVLSLSRSSLPPLPSTFSIETHGWSRYDAFTSSWKSIDFPNDDALVFDVEVLSRLTRYPTLATAASSETWYAWLSPVLFDTSHSPSFEHLIPFGETKKETVIIGHNVSYDRAGIKDEYSIKDSRVRYIDTMSMHMAIAGLSSNQRSVWKKIDKELEEGLEDDVALGDLEWYNLSSLNSLKSVAKFHLGIEMDKSRRDIFIDGDLSHVQNSLASCLEYCANDVLVTHKILAKIFPLLMARKFHGNLVSFAGMAEMGSSFLPISKSWHSYIERCEMMVSEKQELIQENLQRLANEFLTSDPYKRPVDHYLRQLDWNPSTKKNSIPKWYKKLVSSKETKAHITIRNQVTPLLLRMTWQGYPLYYLGKTFGWCYRVPSDEIHLMGNMSPVSIQQLRKNVKEILEKSKSGTSSEQMYLELIEKENGKCEFFKLPTPMKSEKEAICGSPMSKGFLGAFAEGKMSSAHEVARAAIEANIECSYWISVRERVKNQFVVWDNGKERDWGILLPQIISMGTITRRAVEPTWLTASNPKPLRIGSELKTLIQAPAGYKIVGADVDSQELWIAGLLGDAQFGIHGATAFGWMTLQGQKSEGTDLHSKSAQILGSTRDQAKVFNYARIYGSGLKFSANLLSRCDPSISTETAIERAQALYKQTKGTRVSHPSSFGKKIWKGGSESFMFNSLEDIALCDDPRTPTMQCQIPDSLLPESARKKYITSCVNWVVQSSGVDYLHMLLVSMNYLCKKYSIDSRLLLTIHDEIRFLVKEEDTKRAVLALQISNLWVRALFAESAGIPNLPSSVAFFSSVDVDFVLRKEVYDPCKTPSLPNGISTKGHSYTIYDMKDVELGSARELDKPIISVPSFKPEKPNFQKNLSSLKKFIDAQM